MILFVASAIARSFCSNYRVQFFTTEGTEDTEGVRKEKGMGWLAGFNLLSVVTSLLREFTTEKKS
ncbi:hypothetical protein Lepil_1196 [Leptonema illini DSM 21528]|uniref:Uncharacterized protein n=1 Tax=Leptonema illini DSM 21528 TaxID=929563 RepID=H2CHP5_9LEPT|nr:hypothetical protein Lepil_1196 [Leptonema illini DSM 21528]